MIESPTITPQSTAVMGPGRLILVVGPSGAGKDTLLRLAQAAWIEMSDVVFPRRFVTRESSADETNIAVTAHEFHRALNRGDFAMHWEAHGHAYALPIEINDHIRAGRTIVANVSRTV